MAKKTTKLKQGVLSPNDRRYVVRAMRDAELAMAGVLQRVGEVGRKYDSDTALPLARMRRLGADRALTFLRTFDALVMCGRAKA